MTHMSEQDFLEVQYRMRTLQESIDAIPESEVDEGSESALANRIKQWADKKLYPCLVHPRTKKLSWFLPPGYADIVLSLPFGITLYLETKVQKGIWREKQQLMAMQWQQLGHQYHVVKSWKGFLELVEKVTRRE